jgi:RNase H-like domain found in reverse transcriptase/Reverse transcriptase (RNA-dependent DNA polymerase)
MRCTRQIVEYASRPPSTVAFIGDAGPERPDADDWWKQVDVDHLSTEERAQLRSVLTKHASIWDGTLGAIRGVFHRIDTGDRAPVHLQPRRAGPAARETERAEVRRILDAGVIEESEAEWSAPVVLVAKHDGSTRFCVDYRGLNAVTKRDVYPLLRLDECVNSLGSAAYFSTLDANPGFWHIPLDEASKDKTSFSCHAGFIRFKRMPFGLVNAPASFQRAMDIILAGVRWNCALVYMDDVIIYSRTFEEHMGHLDQVLGPLRKANVTQAEEMHLCCARGRIPRSCHPTGRLEMQDAKVAALKAVHRLAAKTQLRSFLGLANVYRRFVPGFAKIAKPLTDLTRDEVPATLPEWNRDQTCAFEQLKDALARPPTLALPQYDREFVLDTDASGYQLGCVLQQRGDDGALHPTVYWSRSLISPELKYSATEREALAIVWAVRTLRHYLEGRRFRVRTDHRALSWIFGAASSDNARLARYRLKLAGIYFVVSHLPGLQNRAADGMSRCETDRESREPRDGTE